MNRLNGEPPAVEIVAKITVVQLPNGKVLCQVEPPLPVPIALGILEQAKLDIHAESRVKQSSPIQVAPPGLRVERNDS